MQVFYVNIGGGEPTVRPDFWELVDYATAHHVGVKFSTNGIKITPGGRAPAGRAATTSTCRSRSTARRPRSTTRCAARARTTPRCGRWRNLADAGFTGFKISVVMTRHNVGQLDEFKAIADRFGAQLRITRLRPSGRGADVWDELHPHRRPAARALRLAGRARRERADRRLVLPPRRLTATRCPGLNLCGAGRVVCLIDPVGDVYACPFAIHDNFLAGNVRDAGRLRRGLARVGAVRRPAPPADRRRLHVLLGLRRLPGRLHGGEVLHRPAARRARPGVRAGPRRAGAGRGGGSARPRSRRSTTRTASRAGAGHARSARAVRPERACDDEPARRVHPVR